jgi:hypothetical protein
MREIIIKLSPLLIKHVMKSDAIIHLHIFKNTDCVRKFMNDCRMR